MSDKPTLEDYFRASDSYEESDAEKIPEEKRKEIDAELKKLHSE